VGDSLPAAPPGIDEQARRLVVGVLGIVHDLLHRAGALAT
jgi:hypothetical protein